ncbi:MAG: hypothetical protein O7F71_11325 [Gammaproteobacteria bacterium]|nr:hypothetical protein [Gammaproteobacteria bacterium]
MEIVRDRLLNNAETESDVRLLRRLLDADNELTSRTRAWTKVSDRLARQQIRYYW